MARRAFCLLCLLLTPGLLLAGEVDLSADADLNTGANLGTLAPGGTGTDVDPWFYQFTTGGLDTSTFKAFTSNGESFTLNLGGFGITGISGGVSLASSRTAYGSAVPAGDLGIFNVGDISVGAIETFSDASYWGQNSNSPAGDLTIGTSGQRAGNIRTDHIDARADFNGSSGDITIYGSGDVLIETSGGTAGNLNGVPWTSAGAVMVDHDGAFTVADVDYYAFGFANSGGDLTFNGDGLSNGASGAFTAGNLNTYSSHSTTSNGTGDISITGYTSVTVTGGIFAYSKSADKWNTNPMGGDVTISAEGDVTVFGQIDLATTRGTAFNGFLDVTATNGGKIQLGDPNDPGANDLDVAGFEYLLFDSSYMGDSDGTTQGETYIYHNILNFTPGGSDTTPNEQFQVAGDVDVVYYYHDETINAGLYAGGDTGLDQGTYYILSHDTFGLGLLAPMPAAAAVPEPATLALLGLGGLGLIAARRRRR